MPEPDHEKAPILSSPKTSTATHVFFGEDGLRAGWGLLAFVLIFIGLSFSAAFISARIHHKPLAVPAQQGTHESPPSVLLIGEGVSLAVVLLATFLMSRIEHRRFGTYGMAGTRPIAHFLQGLVWGILALSLLVFALRTGGFLTFDARLLTNTAAIRYGLIWAFGFTLVALLEENLLRGYLQYTLARGIAGIVGTISDTRHRHAIGFWTAALILSFVFGLGHGSNAGESPIGLFAAGLAGLVFCFSLYRTGSLWWALGAHASWDWAQSFLYGVADSGTMVQGHLYAAHPLGKPILSGGLTGPEGSIFVIPALGLLAAAIVFTLPRTHQPGAGLAHPDAP